MSAPADPHALLTAARAGDRRALGRVVTLVEQRDAHALEAMRALATERPAHVVGITGPPGAGKSSLASALVGAIRASGRSVAVLAVDPSSPVTGGAILGDRVRMQEHARDPGVFIRSMASRGQAGGLAAGARDVVALLARMGFDILIVETVGAGQGEVAVAGLADTTLVVEAPGMGDEVQALKAGLMELADIVVVSKADLPGADRAAAALRAMLTVGAQHDRAAAGRPRPKRPEVIQASSTQGTGVAELLAAIDRRAPDRPATPQVPDAGPADLRPVAATDDRALFGLFRTTLDDLVRRHGDPAGWPYDPSDDADWERWRPLFQHLRSTSDAAWAAEAAGRLVGYARSIRRGDSRELTEFFVLPEAQGQGLGGRLLERAFPADVRHRLILASTDAAALARYLRLGLVATTPVHRFEGPPGDAAAALPADVTARPLAGLAGQAALDALAAVDAQVLGTRRDDDHAWLGAHRSGWLLERSGTVVGYAYGGERQGPIAVLEPSLLVAAVGMLEREARRRGSDAIGLWVPLAAGPVVRHLLAQGYRLDPEPLYLLEDPPRVAIDRYVVTSPPFFL